MATIWDIGRCSDAPLRGRPAPDTGNSTMRKWECIICGFVYDEAEGLPDHDIAPGTRFDDLPDDWECPECGSPKDSFELVED